MATTAQTIIATQHRMGTPILKRIPYRGNEPAYDGIIDYVIMDGNRCIYSGITRNSTSTINAAEGIINTICHREEFEPNEVKFFELLTCRGYGHLHLESCEYFPIVLELDDRGNVKDAGWDACLECPSDIREIFKDHIGTFTVPELTWDQAVAQGFGLDENLFSSHKTAEEALRSIRMDSIGKPDDSHAWAIVDLATNPATTIEDGRRYQTRVKFSDIEEERESRWEMKSLAATRARVVKYKRHGLSQQELLKVTEILQENITSCHPFNSICLSQSMEMFLRSFIGILDKERNNPDWLLGCFLPGVKGVFINLCDAMPGFEEEALSLSKSDDPFEQALGKLAKNRC